MKRICNCEREFNELLDSRTTEDKVLIILNSLAVKAEYGTECCNLYSIGEGASSVAYALNGKVYKVPHIVSSYDDTCTHEPEDGEEYFVDLTADYVSEFKMLQTLSDVPNIVRSTGASYWCLVTELVEGESLDSLSAEELEFIEPELIMSFSKDLSKCIDSGLMTVDYSPQNIVYNKDTNTLTLIDVGEFIPLEEVLSYRNYKMQTNSPIIEHMVGMIGEHYPIDIKDCPINRKINTLKGVDLLMDTKSLLAKVGIGSISAVVNGVVVEGLLANGVTLTTTEKKALLKILKSSADLVPNDVPNKYGYSLHPVYFDLAQVIKYDLDINFNEEEFDRFFNLVKITMIKATDYTNNQLEGFAKELENIVKKSEGIVTLDQLRQQYLTKTDTNFNGSIFSTAYFNYLITLPRITKLMAVHIPYLTENNDYEMYLTESYRLHKKEINCVAFAETILR